jgi:hypothetical protein
MMIRVLEEEEAEEEEEGVEGEARQPLHLQSLLQKVLQRLLLLHCSCSSAQPVQKSFHRQLSLRHTFERR